MPHNVRLGAAWAEEKQKMELSHAQRTHSGFFTCFSQSDLQKARLLFLALEVGCTFTPFR